MFFHSKMALIHQFIVKSEQEGKRCGLEFPTNF